MTTAAEQLETHLRRLEARLAGVAIRPCSFDEPAQLVYLSGVVSRGLLEHADTEGLGILAQPGNSVHVHADAFGLFGADNAFYGLGAKADPTPEAEAAATLRWLRWLEADVLPRANRCLFATIPDVLRWVELEDGTRIPVGDAAATLERFGRLSAIVRKLGLPAALVAQDGLEELEVPWDELDVLFIGGSTEWKLSAAAGELAAEAHRRGKWVHFGRVNSWKRLAIVRELHADSADGTFLGFGPKVNLPKLLAWVARLGREAAVQRLELAA